MGKRLQDIGVENTEENRRKYRQLLFSSDPVSTSFWAFPHYHPHPETSNHHGHESSIREKQLETLGRYDLLTIMRTTQIMGAVCELLDSVRVRAKSNKCIRFSKSVISIFSFNFVSCIWQTATAFIMQQRMRLMRPTASYV